MIVPRVRVGVLAFLAILGFTASAGRAPKSPPNVLLLVLDTVRYDAISPKNTPFLTAFAASRGVTFSNAYSTHDFTPPSHFSIMTGLRDGLGTDDDRSENGIAYQLHRAGYHTFATIANGLVGQKAMPTLRAFDDFKQIGDVQTGSGIDLLTAMTEVDQELALFRVRPTLHARAQVYYDADRLLPVFLDQIRHAKGPYFGFVNLVDAHEPYVPDLKDYAPERNLPPGFDGDVISRRLGPELLHPDGIADPARRAYVKSKIADVIYPRLVSVDLSPAALAIYHARYNATVHELDATLEDFFDVLDREHLLDNTFVIITSDHGESFGEADLVTHMFRDRGDFESTHHVPLIVIPPKGMRIASKVIDRRVSIANLTSTIYDVAGVDWHPYRDRYAEKFARSLFPIITGSNDARQYTIAVTLPKSQKQDQSEAIREREKAMKSLGYVQ